MGHLLPAFRARKPESESGTTETRLENKEIRNEKSIEM